MSGHEETVFPPGYPHQKIDDRVHVKWTPVWASAIGLVALIVVSLGLVRAFELALVEKGYRPIEADELQPGYEKPMSGAPLNPAQVASKQKYLKEQEELLTSYGWVNEEKKIARIPIDAAKAQIVKKYGKEK